MAFEAPLEQGWNPDKFNGPAAGRYHVVVARVDEDGGERGEMIVDFEVVAGTTPDQEGLKHREYFQKSIKAMGRIHTLAIALGMITSADLKRCQSEGRSPVYDFAGQVGKHLCIGLVDEVYNGTVRQKANYDMHAITSPKVVNWPKNLGMLRAAGINLPQPADAPAAPKASGNGGNGDPAKPASSGIDLAGVV